MQKKRGQSSLLQYALWLLGRRRYTCAEIRKKLIAMSKKNTTPAGSHIFEPHDNQTKSDEEISRVIARLEDYGYINDDQYAQLFIQDQLKRKPQGLKLLKLTMAQKGLTKDVITQAINQNSDLKKEKEIDLALLAAKRKLKSLKNTEPKKKAEKLARFLFSRGFGMDTVLKILKEESLSENS